MAERAGILRLDRTTAQGTALDAIDDTGVGDRGMSYLDARARCPTPAACLAARTGG